MTMNKRVLSWTLFDFANSSYSAVISAVIFPVFYTNVIVGNTTGQGDLWWGKAISLSMGFVALTSPLLGGIADYAGIRKRLLMLYTYLCIFCTAGLFFLKEGMVLEGFVLIVLANIGLEGGLVFYNAFLPDIAKSTHQGRVSAWGFALGYLGSILSLLIALFFVKGSFVSLSWPMVSLFFAIFSMPAFLFLPADMKRAVSVIKAATSGVKNTFQTLKTIWSGKNERRFLVAYLFYEDGVNTVIVFSSIFAATTLGFRNLELILLYLIVQTTALTGAFLMAKPIDYWGPKKVVLVSLGLWISVSCATYFVQSKGGFMMIASIAGLGLGTVQAATRAFFTKFIPAGKEAEYFGVYSLVGKSSAIIGPLVFGYISAMTGSQRPAAVSVALFFLVGFFIICLVKGGGPNVVRST